MQKRDRVSTQSSNLPSDSPLGKRRDVPPGTASPPPPPQEGEEVPPLSVVPSSHAVAEVPPDELADMELARRLMEEELERIDDVGLDLPAELRESLGELSPRTRLEVMRDITQQRQVEAMVGGGAHELMMMPQATPQASLGEGVQGDDDDDDDADDDESSQPQNQLMQAHYAHVMNNFGEIFNMLGGGNQNGMGPPPQLLAALHNLHHLVAQRAAGIQDGDDVDNYSYEQLLELEERIGKVNTGLRDNERHRVTSTVFNAKDHAAELDKKCSICLELYQDGEKVSALPCKHTFHEGCISTWVSENNSCPICKQDIAQRS